MKIIVVVALAFLLLILIRRRLLHVDLSFPWFFALVVLGFVSLSERFIDWVARQLGIVDPPLAIILISIFLILGLCTFLAIGLTKLRLRQISLVRHMAKRDLDIQEAKAEADEVHSRRADSTS